VDAIIDEVNSSSIVWPWNIYLKPFSPRIGDY
jgi:hypothetical protein